MPLLLRRGQHTLRGALEGLGRYIEATGAVESSRRFHCSDLLFPTEYSTGIDWSCGVYLPLESMLLVAPNRSLEGLDPSYVYIGSMLWIPMEFHGAAWIGNSTPIQPA